MLRVANLAKRVVSALLAAILILLGTLPGLASSLPVAQVPASVVAAARPSLGPAEWIPPYAQGRKGAWALTYEVTFTKGSHLANVTIHLQNPANEIHELSLLTALFGPFIDNPNRLTNIRATNSTVSFDRWVVRGATEAQLSYTVDINVRRITDPSQFARFASENWIIKCQAMLFILSGASGPASYSAPRAVRLKVNAPAGWVVHTPYPELRPGEFDLEGFLFHPMGLRDFLVVGDPRVLDVASRSVSGTYYKAVVVDSRQASATRILEHLIALSEVYSQIARGRPPRIFSLTSALQPWTGEATTLSMYVSDNTPFPFDRGHSTWAHELFHIYQRAWYWFGDGLSWLKEGSAFYYQVYGLLRAGMMTPEVFVDIFKRDVTSRANPTAVLARYEDIYFKGALVTMALDVMIRRDSGNRFSFDDVVREINHNFSNHQFVAADFLNIVERLTGRSYGDFFQKYIMGSAFPSNIIASVTATDYATASTPGTIVPPPPSDTVPPVITITSATTSSVADYVLRASVSDNVGVVQLIINNVPLPPSPPLRASVSESPVRLSPGANTFTVSAVDAAGNVGKASITVTFAPPVVVNDITPPVISVTAPPSTAAEFVNLDVTVTDNVGVTQLIIANTPKTLVPSREVTLTERVSLAVGVNLVVILASDAAGNWATVRVEVTRTGPPALPRDTLAPSVLVDAPSSVTSPSVTLRIAVSDDTGIAKIAVGEVLLFFPPGAAANVSFTVRDLRAGDNFLNVHAVDASGNLTTHTVLVRYAIPASPVTHIIAIGRPNPAIGLDVPATVRNGRLLVPFRWFAERILGATVAFWVAGAAEIVTLQLGNIKVELTLNSTVARVNGTAVTLDIAPFATGGRTLVPARFLAETFGYLVDWNSATNEVTFTPRP